MIDPDDSTMYELVNPKLHQATAQLKGLAVAVLRDDALTRIEIADFLHGVIEHLEACTTVHDQWYLEKELHEGGA